MIPSVDHCKTEFDRVSRQRRLSEPMQFSHMRWEALDRFLSAGFPTTRDEGWAFTNVAPIADQIFTVCAEPRAGAYHADLNPFPLPGVFGTELVFVNGYYVADASTTGRLPAGARVEPIAAVLHANPDDVDGFLAGLAPFERPFAALNTALFVDGACIRIPAQCAVRQPIHVRFISTGEADMRPAMSSPRVLIVLDEGSEATIVESYAGRHGVEYFTNAVTEIILADNARLDHYRLQHESTAAYHVSATYATAGRGARCSTHSVSLGGALVRNEVVAVLGGENGQCAVDTLLVAGGQRLVDNHTTIDHAMPHCRSRHVSRGILDGQATGVSTSRIAVRADAHKTTATHSNRTLLLSRGATTRSTPQLDILANEVHCSQRTVVRHVDDDAPFYMQSRGLGSADAARLAIANCAGVVLKRLPLQPLRSSIRSAIRGQLPAWMT